MMLLNTKNNKQKKEMVPFHKELITSLISLIDNAYFVQKKSHCESSTYSYESDYCKFANKRIAKYSKQLIAEDPENTTINFNIPRFDLLLRFDSSIINYDCWKKKHKIFQLENRDEGMLSSIIAKLMPTEKIEILIDIENSKQRKKLVNEFKKYYGNRYVDFENKFIEIVSQGVSKEYGKILDAIANKILKIPINNCDFSKELKLLKFLYNLFSFAPTNNSYSDTFEFYRLEFSEIEKYIRLTFSEKINSQNKKINNHINLLVIKSTYYNEFLVDMINITLMNAKEQLINNSKQERLINNSGNNDVLRVKNYTETINCESINCETKINIKNSESESGNIELEKHKIKMENNITNCDVLDTDKLINESSIKYMEKMSEENNMMELFKAFIKCKISSKDIEKQIYDMFVFQCPNNVKLKFLAIANIEELKTLDHCGKLNNYISTLDRKTINIIGQHMKHINNNVNVEDDEILGYRLFKDYYYEDKLSDECIRLLENS
jgi:hypothetical protein